MIHYNHIQNRILNIITAVEQINLFKLVRSFNFLIRKEDRNGEGLIVLKFKLNYYLYTMLNGFFNNEIIFNNFIDFWFGGCRSLLNYWFYLMF